MGNSLSAEAPWRGHRINQKLSKPKTGNPTAAGLLNLNGASPNPARSAAERRLSLPTAPSPAPFLDLPETDHVATTSDLDGKKEPGSGNRLSRMLFRSNTSKELPSYRQRSGSVGKPSSRQGRWYSRANSLVNGSKEVLDCGPVPQGTLSINGSRTSFNYDIGSYDAQRMLNLVEVPSHEGNSVITENQKHNSETMWDERNERRPSIPDTNAPLPRANSEISLYTTMRRRSLMSTPGVATREVRPDPSSSRGKARYSLPSTPSRRQSIESMGVQKISFPPPLISSDPIPRALTPSEAEYKQTGAFKLGTLRITNGSPARSPARDPHEAIQHESTEGSALGGPIEDYFGTAQVAPRGITEVEPSGRTVEKVESQNISIGSDTTIAEPTSQIPASPQLVSDIQVVQLNDGKLLIPQIQVTSKHSALEDELFNDELNEYSSVEVLDVRVDTNAKSLPARPKLSVEQNSRDIARSDSGIASPASEYSHAALSKADSGYSSSVSLRSFSSKPAGSERDRGSDVEVEVTPSEITQQSIESKEPDAPNSPITVANADASELSHVETPPPVPVKEPRRMALVNPKASGDLSPSYQQKSPLRGLSNGGPVPQRVLSPRGNIRSQNNNSIESRRTSLLNPNVVQSNNSALSISTSFRKPGKLQRFLSGSRTSLIVHNTHPTEHSRVPAVSRDMQVKLQSHSRRLPTSFRRLALKSAASKETLGTIFSVGSAELLSLYDEDTTSTNQDSKSTVPDEKVNSMSVESSIAKKASTFTMKPVPRLPRKPVPVRNHELGAREDFMKSQRITRKLSKEGGIQAVPWHGANGAPYDSNQLAKGDERLRYSVPAVRINRANTMTGYGNSVGEPVYASNRRSSDFGQGKSHSTTSLELPPVGTHVRMSKSPPPVSMRTRKHMGSLRVPPPPRPQSTPPEHMKQPSRRGSRDGNLMIPRVAGALTPNHPVVSQKSSRESFHNSPYAQNYRYANAPGMSPANNPQPTGPKMQTATLSRRPSWDIQPNHGPSLSRRPSSENYSRRNSLASQSSQRSSASRYHPNPSPPSLHRRSSYDDYNLVPQDSSLRDNGPYPSISRNGQSVVSDPWSGRTMSMPQQWDQQWDQPSRNSSYSPRHHYRRRSLDQNGNPAPYRVLHSYHSPAYKNVPIWG